MLFRQPPQGLAIDPIAFLDPVGNVINHLAGAGQLQAGPQDAGAADTVHVIIAVDDDGPVFADGPDDAFGRLDDPRQDSGSFNWVSLAARKATARSGSSIPRLINNWAVSGEIPAARESDAIRSESNGFSRHRVVIRVGSPAS